jgi:broad specificity phosphatase PhoE
MLARGQKHPGATRLTHVSHLSGAMTDHVWILRHGQRQDSVDPDWADYAERVHDPGLTDHGHWQAGRAAERLRSEGICRIYASPFLRAVQTADHVGRALEMPVALEPGLSEHRNPDWFDADPETLGHETAAERYESVELDREPLVEPEFPESHAEAEARIGRAARRVVAATDADVVLLVGHGATVGGVAAGLVGSTDGVDAPLAGLTELRRDGEDWRLVRSGDTDHLA